MLRRRSVQLLPFLLFVSACLLNAATEGAIRRIYSDAQQNVHVVLDNAKDIVTAAEKDQAAVDEIKIAEDKETAGWLVLYKERVGDSSGETEVGAPFAGKLVIWRRGKIIRSFAAAQTFWSWAFEHGGDQVAYHDGPTHGETASHCELRDVLTGMRLASWNGAMDDPLRPSWTRNLDH